jgi:UDP-N-acetylglucosamine--N-acetylmuramyl-(pentapeptide) pyrophosphoryl-undecaprenol N-acetylglucosamine transferase
VLATVQVLRILRKQRFDGVVGFGGYVSTPAYLAAAISRVPLVVHEANARAGFANRLGARFTKHIAVCFPNTNLPAGRLVGMPLRPEFVRAGDTIQKQARIQLGLDPTSQTLLVTGGSQDRKSVV